LEIRQRESEIHGPRKGKNNPNQQSTNENERGEQKQTTTKISRETGKKSQHSFHPQNPLPSEIFPQKKKLVVVHRCPDFTRGFYLSFPRRFLAQ
jgi:hypothetical protein